MHASLAVVKGLCWSSSVCDCMSAAVGVMKANWPPFLPIIRHDIRADIPEYLRALQRTAFFTWMGAPGRTCRFCCQQLAEAGKPGRPKERKTR